MTKVPGKAGLKELRAEIIKAGDKYQASILQRFFKTGPGQYGAGDIFLGIRVPNQRKIAANHAHLSLDDIAQLLADKYHEIRLMGLLILIRKYELADSRADRKKIVDFYLAHTKGINNWDLVDLSVYKILGDYLVIEAAGAAKKTAASDVKKSTVVPAILLKLARSKNLWERRMAMVASYAFIKDGRPEVAFALAEKLMGDNHDLMHKAVGWMLREAGKRNGQDKLMVFLDKHAGKMPRTALRYAIERLTPAERDKYLGR